MPYEITIEDHFAAAHYLVGYRGSCENVHGHNFKVEVTCSIPDLDDIGISLDFKELKGRLGEITARFDHTNLNECNGLRGENPTAENLARYIYTEIADSLNNTTARVKRVTVHESEKYSATYYE